MNKKEMQEIVENYAQTLEGSHYKAKVYSLAQVLANASHNDSVARVLVQDHRSISHALRAARILIECGLCEERNKQDGHFGEMNFVDGSILTSHAFFEKRDEEGN